MADTASSTQQAQQRALVEQAQKMPGVAEAMQAYNALTPWAPVIAYHASSTVVYATGGNAR